MQIIFERKDGGNVLTAESIREMFTVYDAVRKVTTAEKGKLLLLGGRYLLEAEPRGLQDLWRASLLQREHLQL